MSVDCLKCAFDLFKDPYNALLNICGSIQVNATCGNSSFYLQTLSDSVSININSLDYGQSCSYRLVSNCGYPKIRINQTGIDAVVASLPNISNWKSQDFSFSFDKALTETLKAIDGHLSYTFGDGESIEVDQTCGKNRTIFVTVTNLNKATPTSRLLAAENNIGLTFSAT